MASSSNIALINTIEWAKRFNFNRGSAIGDFLEPAITNANLILQTVTSPPFSWRWNRVMTGFITTAGQQDYTLFNYLASTAVSLGWLTVDDGGNCHKCTTAGSTGSSAPSWNHALAGTTSDGSVTWTNQGTLHNSEAVGNYSLGWIETSSIYDINAIPLGWYELKSMICLGLDSTSGRPSFISAQNDDGLGNITFRLQSVPDATYSIVLTLQKKPPLFNSTTGLTQTWAPIPDEYSHIYNWGYLSLYWLFADDPRWVTANGKFVSALLGTNQGLTQTQVNIFLQQWQSVTGQPIVNLDNTNQGFQARQQ